MVTSGPKLLKGKVPLRTAPSQSTTRKQSSKRNMGTRSIPVSMPNKQDGVLFDLLALMTGNENNRSEIVRILLEPYLEAIRAILKSDNLLSDQNKFMISADDALDIYRPGNLSEDAKLRNLKIFEQLEKTNPNLRFAAIIRHDKLFQ